MRPGTLRPPRNLNLSHVVACAFHFALSIHRQPQSRFFRKFSARQLSEITIVKMVYYMIERITRCNFML